MSQLILLGLIPVALFLIVTSFIWIPILLFVGIPLSILIYFIANFTPLGKPIVKLYYTVYDWLFYQSEAPRKFLWGQIYNFMCRLYPQSQWKAMNYGYATVNQDGKLIKNLKPEDEEERFCFQLYHFMATKFGKIKDLSGLDVIEIGSGRGGGLNYILNYLNPNSCTGVDLSQNQVDFCKKTYAENPKIKFFQGDAEKIDEISSIKPNSYNIVLNIESSHCYGNFNTFLDQVHSLLKIGGYFLFTDFRTQEGYEQLKKIFAMNQEKWDLVAEEDITLNVVQSLKQDEKRRRDLIVNNVYIVLQPFFIKFSGLEGSRINKEFQERQTVYVAFILQKK
ncbi:hypothetical protein PPERSA_04012 [Pseudocohnilembus persalinus]|uniref:Methyltransferase domain-containing protein n=1 Tax=Pseudocohnilembus persalinus TaxID=266149 RepID=A0A0V0QKH5_PSEPJ|nr:hypothetical protein PPERSA_04012 [Pseudocohnilembus persalinus]|eukprot:KRX02809.1 hypothetical protein PPERSA_04012 [Pseudocohnilembus persalinus]